MTQTEMSAPAAEKQPATKPKKVRGKIQTNASRCKGCGFCIAFCPPHALEFSDEFNSQGYHYPYLAHPDNCTGCDLCGLYCPDFAIYGVMEKIAPGNPPRPKASVPPAGNGAAQERSR